MRGLEFVAKLTTYEMTGYGRIMVLGSLGMFPLLSVQVTMVFHLGL